MKSKRKRWPRDQEEYRKLAEQASEDGIELVHSARENVPANPTLADAQLADIGFLLARIKAWMIEAKIGRE